MVNSITCVKGVSGSGKSTRVFLLLDFFKSQGFTVTDFHYVNGEGKDKVVGMLVEELNLIFIGKLYQTGKITRFQGYDAVTSAFINSAGFSDFLKFISPNYSVIVEGAGVTQTNRLRPKFLFEFCGYDTVFMQYYNYRTDQKEEYIQRIVYRTGEAPKRNTMWDKCIAFEVEAKKTDDEMKELGDAVDVVNFYNLYDTEVTDFGVKFLYFIGLDILIEPFQKYCAESTYLIDNSFNSH